MYMAERRSGRRVSLSSCAATVLLPSLPSSRMAEQEEGNCQSVLVSGPAVPLWCREVHWAYQITFRSIHRNGALLRHVSSFVGWNWKLFPYSPEQAVLLVIMWCPGLGLGFLVALLGAVVGLHSPRAASLRPILQMLKGRCKTTFALLF